ncbi:uncharacterized protein Dmoj_GI26339 [Drosophila mojavensis]|uniref:TFIIF beta subunit HTH domain-containing protein n=1 Tax=Drosophila mojavensis TaxID=7230 RepID=A0A0Q9XU35_DROMO|nr:uncharacterized protein Dmoj_GI26339 [Drosophila mojavensis]
MESEPDSPIASEHELKLCKTAEGTNLTGIFSTLDNEEPSMEGWITHKMQCLPVYNTQYLKMKEHYFRSAKPPRRVKPLNHIVNNYKPVSSNAHNAILKDIGDYNKDPAHKKMWELKEEYRRY